MPVTVMASDFIMHGAREAIDSGFSHIEAQVKAIERAVVENPGLAFDLAKTVVESVCKTILKERKIEFNSDDDLAKLFKAVANELPLLPIAASNETEARRSLAQTLSGLHTVLQGVCELRNAYGFASHGAEGPRPVMESVQAMLAAQAADAIVGFLHRVHRQERATLPGVRLTYHDNESFNMYLDDENEVVRIFDLEYRPSEVLFFVDSEAYRDFLSSFELKGISTEKEADAQPEGET